MVPAASLSVNFVAGSGFILGSSIGIFLSGQWGIQASPVGGVVFVLLDVVHIAPPLLMSVILSLLITSSVQDV